MSVNGIFDRRLQLRFYLLLLVILSHNIGARRLLIFYGTLFKFYAR